jgi:hypothetical protein
MATTSNTVAVRVAVENIEKSLGLLRNLGEEGQREFDRLTNAANRTAQAVDVASKAIEEAGTGARSSSRTLREFGEFARQAGFQVGDFAVQVTSGTDALVALSQQGSQLAGSLGVFGNTLGIVGAAAGALGAVLAGTILYFRQLEDAAAETPTALDDFIDAMDEAKDKAEEYQQALDGASGATRTLIAELAKLDKEQIDEATAAAGDNIAEVLQGLNLRDLLKNRTPAPGQVANPGGLINLTQLAELEAAAESNADALLARVETLVRAGDSEGITELFVELDRVNKVSRETINTLVELANARKALNEGTDPNRIIFGSSRDPVAERQERQEILEGQREADAERQKLEDQRLTDLQTQVAAELQIVERAEKARRDLEQQRLDFTIRNLDEEVAAADKADKDRAKLDEDRLEQTLRTLNEDLKAFEDAQDEKAKIAERAAREAERQAGVDNKAITIAEFEADAARRLAEANKVSEESYRQVKIQIDAERDSLEASFNVTGAALVQIRRFNQLKAEQELITRATTEARDEETRRLKEYNQEFAEAEREADAAAAGVRADQEAEAQRIAKQQADILAQPFRELTAEIAGVFSDTISTALTDASNYDFSDVASSFADAMVNAVSGIGGALIAAPVNAAIAQIATQAAQPGQSLGGAALNFAKQNPTLAAGAAGVVGGSLIAQATGGSGKFGALGGGLGAAGGFAAGTALAPILLATPLAPLAPFAPYIGAAIGGAGGGFLGGLLGSENDLGNDRSAQVYNSRRGRIVYSDESFSQENRNVTQGILSEVQTLQEALSDLGGAISGFSLRVEAGNKSGITVNGKRYPDAQTALQASLEELLGSTTGLSATEQTIIANTQGRTGQEIAKDLSFADTYDQLTFTGNAYRKSVDDLNATYADAIREAQRLKLNTDALVASQQKQLDILAFQYQQERDGLVLQLRQIKGEQSLGLQLDLLNEQMQDLAQQAIELEVPLNLVTEAHEAAAQALIKAQQELIRSTEEQERALEGQLESQVRSVQDLFSNWIDPLREVIANDNTMSPLGQIAQARSRFRETAALAESGDLEGIEGLAGAASELQDLAGRYLGAAGAADIRREIEGRVGSQLDVLERQRDEALASIPQVQRETAASVIASNVENTNRIVEELRRLRYDLDAMRRAAA